MKNKMWFAVGIVFLTIGSILTIQLWQIFSRIQFLEQSKVSSIRTLDTPMAVQGSAGYQGICDLYVVVCPNENYQLRIQ